MSEAPDFTPGFFGKLPALGDFVQRRLPGSFVKVWDGWLQAAIASSKAQLGEHWLDTYLSSPVWRFALLPGIGGDQGWGGVIMPSVDRVGRYFPLTVAGPLPDHARVFTLVDAHEWYEQAESTILSALDDEGFELDAFAAAVGELGACQVDCAELPGAESVPTMRSGWQFEIAEIGAAGGALQGVAELLAQDRFGKFSLWWTSGSELVAPSFLVCPGLPDPQSYSAMLDGRWSESNWHSFGSRAAEAPPAEEPPLEDTALDA